MVPSTALVAAAHGRLEVARLLLDAGADPSLAASDGLTPLMCAAGQGHPEVLGLLLGRGAVVDAAHPDSGATAFHQACFSNQPDCVEALARAGCDVGLKVRFEPLTWRPIGRQVGPEVGPTSACSSCIPTGMRWPTCQPNIFHAQGKDVAVNITISGSTSARSADKDEDGWTTAVRPRPPS